MVDLRKCEDEKSKQHWAFVEATSNIVRRWPRWKVAAAGLCPLTGSNPADGLSQAPNTE